MFTLHGTGVGFGIAIGAARLIRRPDQEVLEYSILPEQVGQEIQRLTDGIHSATECLSTYYEDLREESTDEVHAILDAHLLMVQDPILLEQSALIIRERLVNAEFALQLHCENLQAVFRDIDDPYMRSKSDEISQVIGRIQDELLGQHAGQSSLEGIREGEIVVTHDLMPADTIEYKKYRVGAFLTNLGGPISHTAILARSMQIPAIVGLHEGIRYLKTGDTLIIDGKRGVVLVEPDDAALDVYEKRAAKIKRVTRELEVIKYKPATTLDGQTVELNANIEFAEELKQSLECNASGIGLYRTESLYMNRRDFPDEAEQFDVYSTLLNSTERPVTIRTLDLGADKQVDGGRRNMSLATNPALGRRAIRLCLHDLTLFKPQLRALYRASIYGDLRIMVPMISSQGELDQLFIVLDEIRDELTRENLPFKPHIPVGGMIEVPAAAVTADMFAKRLDFLSIGTNDLIQYTLAIDRIDDEVNYLYDPLHPAVLRLVKSVIDAAQNAGIPVSMCGEMAGDIECTRILLALGLREFSMDSTVISEVKQRVRGTRIGEMEPIVRDLLTTNESDRYRDLIQLING